MTADSQYRTIAVIGGTGKEGRGLAYRWCRAGHRVVIGSRDAGRASAAAEELRALVGSSAGPDPVGATNADAAAEADIVVLTVPYTAHRGTLESIKPSVSGKLLVDATVPLTPGRVSRVQMPPAGSAALETREILEGACEIAAAFHTISHEHLLKDAPIDCDVLVTGTSKDARAQALELVADAGLQGWDAGALDNSAVTEGLTSLLIHINRRYGSSHAGIRITGVDQP
jgi:NADPH-dependent F420 reductase